MQQMQRLGGKLRTLRQRRGLSQRQLATQIGIGKSFISSVENNNGTPSARLILQIADFFAVSVETLMRDELELDEE